MKRRNMYLLLAFCGMLLPFVTSAKAVSQAKAIETANLFFYGNLPTRGSIGLTLKWNSNEIVPATKGGDTAPAFYVFSGNRGQGFVIVAGDDIIKPILGYSFDKQAPEANDLPQGLHEWLNDIAEHIGKSRAQGATPSAEVKAEWDALAKEKIQTTWARTRAGEEGKVLETAEWGQTAPFNNECPFVNMTDRASAGNIPVAIGIIMHYHKWPDAGIGSSSYYRTSTLDLPVQQRNLEIPYEWDKMLMEYKEGAYTQDEANAVARLLADIGTIYETDYKKENSFTNFTNTYLQYCFKYDSGMSLIGTTDIFKDKFDDLIINELNNRRPVLYCQYSSTLVIDGYDNADNFHINWGNGGKSNGYFAITSFSKENKHRAYIKLMPDTKENNVPDYWLMLYGYGMKSDIEKPEDYAPEKNFNLTINLNNRTAVKFKGYIRPAIVNNKGEIKEWISHSRAIELTGGTFASITGSSNYSTTFYCKFTQEANPGDKIRLFYSTDNQLWNNVVPDPAYLQYNTVSEIFIAEPLTIRESTSIKYDHKTKIFTFTYKNGVKPTILVNGTPVTDGVTADSTKASLDITGIRNGKFTIRLEKQRECEEIEIQLEKLKQQ